MRSTETARLRGRVWSGLLFVAVLVPARDRTLGRGAPAGG